MSRSRDVQRFDRWAESYDRLWMQGFIFEPVQRTVLDLAEHEVPRPGAILDAGCGTGRLLRSASTRFVGAELPGVDPAPEMVRQAQLRAGDEGAIHFQLASAEKLPFPDHRFDLVFSTLAFHHRADQRKAVAEMARALAPGGRWLLVDFRATGLMRHVRWLLQMRRFPERESLAAMLAPSGSHRLRERKVVGLHGQVAVLAIGSPD